VDIGPEQHHIHGRQPSLSSDEESCLTKTSSLLHSFALSHWTALDAAGRSIGVPLSKGSHCSLLAGCHELVKMLGRRATCIKQRLQETLRSSLCKWHPT
jgi:hypothetical protein